MDDKQNGEAREDALGYEEKVEEKKPRIKPIIVINR